MAESRRSLTVNMQAVAYLGKIMARLSSVIAVLLVLVIPRPLHAEARVETNVVYGMYSGLALLMDVYYPENPNGYGIVRIAGSGFHMPLDFDSRQLKADPDQIDPGSSALLEAGYTLFRINHRAAPRFQYPANVEDGQRAVRFVRHHAERFGIDSGRIGAYGGSSGGYLACMLGVLDGDGLSGSTPINQESSKVQAVVAWYPPTDFVDFHASGFNTGAESRFLGASFNDDPQSAENHRWIEASPTTYVSTDDPPFLLVHGDADPTVPFSQSEVLEQRLSEAGVEVELIRVPGGGHGRRMEVPNAPDYVSATVDWFDRYLRMNINR